MFMVMLSKVETYSTVVDGEKTLPFRLILLSRNRKHRIPISRLTSNPQEILNYLYEVIEFMDLEIMLDTSENLQVQVNWGNVSHHEEDMNFQFTLDHENNVYSLFLYSDIGKTVGNYPWRCGLYHFEVKYKDETYYGGFKVSPKNVDEEQLEKIHEFINSRLEGLVLDYLHHKKTFSNLAQIKMDSHWQFIQWYKKTEKKLHQSLNMIENVTENNMNKSYLIEKEPKHLDNKSIRWLNSAKGQFYQYNGYLNRKLFLDNNSKSNRLVKFRLRAIINKIKNAVETLDEVIHSMELQWLELKDDIDELHHQVNKIQSDVRVSSKEKTRMKNSLITKEIEKNEVEQHLQNLKKTQKDLFKSLNLLYGRLSSDFWSKIDDRPPKKLQFEKFIGYQVFQDIWKQYVEKTPENTKSSLEVPVYKPTHELYEYFVLLGVIFIFEELGFSAFYDSVREQLMSTFYEGGLMDGTTVMLRNNEMQVEVIYEGMVEHNDSVALAKNTNFFSSRTHRKPDIRIALYKEHEGDLKYCSTFIVEVKYRPLFNIYSDLGNTKTMEQMNDYWSITYVYEENDEVKYNRNSVAQVVCVYPGDKKAPLILKSAPGDFLQYYPYTDSGNSLDIVGKEDLKRLIEKWLEKV